MFPCFGGSLKEIIFASLDNFVKKESFLPYWVNMLDPKKKLLSLHQAILLDLKKESLLKRLLHWILIRNHYYLIMKFFSILK